MKVHSTNLPFPYGGMNYYAARHLKIRWPYGKNDIAIGRHETRRKEIIEHERIERDLMRRGVGYSRAHMIANQKRLTA